MGLFDKKFCDICGDKIGLLGNRKLEDGNLCKNCAAKLSPWFTGRRHSTLADIKSQLADREANASRVAAFNCTKKLGNGYKALYIDETNGNFAVCTESDLKGKNPDIIPLSSIISVVADNDERRSERKKKDAEGKMVSYNPPQYDYHYEFYCEIKVDHPYIDEIRFDLNNSSIVKENSLFSPIEARKFADSQKLCMDITMALTKPVAPAPAHEQEISLPEAQYPFLSTDSMGDLSLLINATTKARYVVKNPSLYNAIMTDGGAFLNNAVSGSVIQAFFALQNQGKNAMDIVMNPTILSDLLLQNLKSTDYDARFGIEFVSAILIPRFSDTDREAIKQRFQTVTMYNSTPIQQTSTDAPNPFIPNAATVQATGPWTCPCCNGANDGGNFCEYCGAKRP